MGKTDTLPAWSAFLRKEHKIATHLTWANPALSLTVGLCVGFLNAV